MKLVIVESPAKATTIQKFLGKDYKVLASFGHVRDLPKSASEIPVAHKSKPWARLGVDVDADFHAIYVVQRDSAKQINELKKAAKEAEEIILATDEDREGESISWHLLEVLKPRVPIKRIAFHEITKSAIDAAMRSPRDINQPMVRAQETRRILDRLFGYELSPVLWRKVGSKLSAGRVQSVALRLVVEREEDRRRFVRAGYWDAEAVLNRDGKQFKATLISLNGCRIATGKDFDDVTGALLKKGSGAPVWLKEEEARALVPTLQKAVPWKVASVEEKESQLHPSPPFITSSLQQAASTQLGFSPRKTMQVAQKLYEGVDLGDGNREGLITYMRTDSVILSEKALQDASAYIHKHFGEAYHKRRQFTTKSKMAQEAHEAIRPTDVFKTPASLSSRLGKDEFRLYQLIWNRTLASQMAAAQVMRTTVDIAAAAPGSEALFRATGAVVVFPGFLEVMNDRQRENELPPLAEGMKIGADSNSDVLLESLEALQHETQPPARYTEASLVRRLEEEGIGRPSTYAPTVAVIQQRGYVSRCGTALAPTYLGIAVVMLLRKYFSTYVDLGFTAQMEDILDAIAGGEEDWLAFLRRFYHGEPASNTVGLKPDIDAKLEMIEYPAIPLGTTEAGEPVVVRLGKTTPFIQRGAGGDGNTISLPDQLFYDELTLEKALELLENQAQRDESLGICPDTGKPILLLEGPFGPYVQLGEAEKGTKPKRTGLPKGMALESCDLEKALYLLSLPRELGLHPETKKAIVLGIGRFGPYVVHDGDFRSIKADDFFSVTFETALALLQTPKASAAAKKLIRTFEKQAETDPEISLYQGRYGPYVTDGSVNASLPAGTDLDGLTLEQALALIAVAAERKKNAPPRKASAKKPAAKKTAAKKAAVKKAPAKKAAAKKPAVKKATTKKEQ
ncbi:MAG: DNA topoisomerase 1 [Candidatus Hydrogenedentes bacterium ADurb.Bin170]|nr:MAG: DNA topoisomerase 1 [Candidatus Hydrogenedentes bacterium ADurb.Bin170]